MSFLGCYQDLLRRVESAVDQVLETEVAETVKDVMENQLEHQVYSYEASAQAMATRRLDAGGLLDRQGMASRVEAEHTLIVENTAPFQGSPVDYTTLNDVVERGEAAFRQPGPRPFVAGTQEQAVAPARTALLDGLRRQGF